MTDHSLTPDEMNRLLAQHDRRAKLFERLATGRHKGEFAHVVEDPQQVMTGTEAEMAEQNEATRRNAVTRAMFWYKAACERVAAAQRHREREAAAMAAADYTWRPVRPTRR